MSRDGGSLYAPGIDVGAPPPSNAAPTQLNLDSVPATATYGSTLTGGAPLTGAPTGSTVTFDLGQGPVPATRDANGPATAPCWAQFPYPHLGLRTGSPSSVAGWCPT